MTTPHDAFRRAIEEAAEEIKPNAQCTCGRGGTSPAVVGQPHWGNCPAWLYERILAIHNPFPEEAEPTCTRKDHAALQAEIDTLLEVGRTTNAALDRLRSEEAEPQESARFVEGCEKDDPPATIYVWRHGPPGERGYVSLGVDYDEDEEGRHVDGLVLRWPDGSTTEPRVLSEVVRWMRQVQALRALSPAQAEK